MEKEVLHVVMGSEVETPSRYQPIQHTFYKIVADYHILSPDAEPIIVYTYNGNKRAYWRSGVYAILEFCRIGSINHAPPISQVEILMYFLPNATVDFLSLS